MKKNALSIIAIIMLCGLSLPVSAQQLTDETKKNEIGIVGCRTMWNSLQSRNLISLLSGFSYQRRFGEWNGRISLLYDHFGKIEGIRSHTYSPSNRFETSVGIGRTFLKKFILRPVLFSDISFQSVKEYQVITGFGGTTEIYHNYHNLIIYAGSGIEFEPIRNILLKYEARIGIGYSSGKTVSINYFEPFNQEEYLSNGKTVAGDLISALSLAIRF